MDAYILFSGSAHFQHAAEGALLLSTNMHFALNHACTTPLSTFSLVSLSVYGKIIISERYLPYEEKTIKPEKDMGSAFSLPQWTAPRDVGHVGGSCSSQGLGWRGEIPLSRHFAKVCHRLKAQKWHMVRALLQYSL